MHKIIWLALLAVIAAGQTQVDLRTQSKGVDFSGANSTKPMATGTTLPATCTTGQMFFVTSATAGQNLYGCVTSNNWVLEAGGSGGGSGSAVAVESAGVLVGTSSTLDFTVGTGSLYAISMVGQAASIESSADTSVLESFVRSQSGSPLLCASASGSATTYTCSMAPTLTQYTIGMNLNWQPDVSGTGGPTTMNVDSLGVISVKLADGATDPGSADIVAGRFYGIWYDGATFRLGSTVVPAGVLGEALPVCGTTVRGRLWFVSGASGVKDSLSVCARDETNTYAWRSLY
jgi:hypothetical protein